MPMSIWKDQSPAKKDSIPLPPEPAAFRETASSGAADFSPTTLAPPRVATAVPAAREAKESLIAADITIEGKIEGTGHVRIAGKFKGDVNVQGDLTIETGAKLNGGVRAKKVTIAGELEGNIEAASQVELLSSGVLIGDLKAGSLTVAAGSRMRGQADFGWDDTKASSKSSQSKDKDTDSASAA
jgi:cytoskeletal protein CcmA (bactofilin family)